MLLFILLFLVSWPLYKYVFDVDGIGYIGAAKQYALGNYQLAVNGYWSPLHSWLVVPFIKLGLLPEDSFRLSNALIGIGCLVTLHLLLNKLDINASLKSGIQYSFAVILLSYASSELAADLLLVFVLFLLFNLCLSNQFYGSIQKNLLAGVIGAFAFFAKAYAFPFFIVFFLALHICFNKERKFYTLIAGLAVFLLISFIWIYALHWKYGEWMIAHGKNNYGNWNVKYRDLSGPLLLPPPYPGSPAVWEDPWKIDRLNFTQSSITEIVTHQIRIILFNIQKWLKCLHEISFLSAATLFGSVILFWKKKEPFWLFLLITVCSLSAGYLLLHVETRFLWPLTVLLFAGGAILLQKIQLAAALSPKLQLLVWIVFFGSFLLGPVNELKDNIYRGKPLYQTAEKLKAGSINGKFVSNIKPGECMVMAYLTGNTYYSNSRSSYSTIELIHEIDKNRIRHYYFFYNSQQQKEDFLKGSVASKSVQYQEIEPGFIVFSFY